MDDEDVNASEGRADGVDDVFFTIANNGLKATVTPSSLSFSVR